MPVREALSSKQAYQEWKADRIKRQTNPELYGLRSTGIRGHDNMLGGGIELGQFILYAAEPGGYKTTLLLHIFKAFARQKVLGIWVGMEMTVNQTLTMVMSNMTGIPRTQIRALGLKEVEWKMIEDKGLEVVDWPVYWHYGISSLKDLWQVIRQVEKETGQTAQSVFGDYLQLMEEGDYKGSRTEEIGHISRGLKRMSVNRELPMAVLFNSQFNREASKDKLKAVKEGDTKKPHTMFGLLGSGSLERDSDAVFGIEDVIDPQTKQVDPTLKQLTTLKGREIPGGTCRVRVNGAIAKMEDEIHFQ